MDIDLGPRQKDGTEVAENILETRDIPIVFLSSHTEPEVVDKTKKITSYGYILKNSEESVFFASVEMAFRLHDAYAELRKRERESKFQAELLEAVNQAVIATDIEGRIIYWNRGAEELYEWTEDEVMGLNIGEVTVPEMSRDQATQIMERLAKGESWSGEFLVRNKRGKQFFARVTNSPIMREGREMAGIIGLSFDVSERIALQNRLRESEETFHHLYESMAQGVVYHDAEGNITSANPAAGRILGLSYDQLTGKTPFDPRWKTIHEDGSPFPGESHPAMEVLKTGTRVMRRIMGVYHPGRQEYLWLSVSAIPEFRNGEEKPFRVFATFEDITEQHRFARKQQENWKFLETIFDAIQDFISIQDSELNIIHANRMVQEMYRDRLPIEGRKCYEVYHGLASPCERCPSLRAMRRKSMEKEIVRYSPSEGEDRWFEMFSYPILSEDGVVRHLVEYARDVTTTVEAQEASKRLIEEKDTLLKEIHHRVKNNMSIVASLLSLQSQSLRDEKGKEALLESRYRVVSLQKLYERLFDSDIYTEINLSIYLDDIIQELSAAYGSETVTIYSEVLNIYVEVREAVPIGIIVNELVTNAVKYAFPEGERGEIRISLKAVKTAVILSIADNGTGLPEEQQKRHTKGFGLKVVDLFVDQLEGNLEVRTGSGEGTEYLIDLGPHIAGKNLSVSS
jgi:PAS domain S-box-containing protein